MSTSFAGFVGLHPTTAHTRRGEKVLCFSLGVLIGNDTAWHLVTLTGPDVDEYDSIIKPGTKVMVVGEFRRRKATGREYFAASHVESCDPLPPHQLDFPFVA